jgi:SAM-dependent methyltransferase
MNLISSISPVTYAPTLPENPCYINSQQIELFLLFTSMNTDRGLADVLLPIQFSRTFWDICDEIQKDQVGIDLFAEALKPFEGELDEDRQFTILDLGCGSGTAIEHLSLLYRHIFPQFTDRIRCVGVDPVLRPELIPRHLFEMDVRRQPLYPHRIPNGNSDRELTSTLFQGVATDLSMIDDDSIDFGFSYATLIYVADSLRALEEVHRVLKPGARCIIEVCSKELSVFPSFPDILEVTPGAKTVFTYLPSKTHNTAGYIVCTKSIDDIFQGFPFHVFQTCMLPDALPDTKRWFYRNAVYAPIGCHPSIIDGLRLTRGHLQYVLHQDFLRHPND